MAGQTRIDSNLIDTGTDPNDIVSVSVGDGRYPRLSQDNTLAGNLTVDGQVRSDNVTDSAGTGAPAFPNGMSVTGAALTDPEITGGIFLGGTGTANKLDDYEEGTFTTTVTVGGGSVTTSTAGGIYTKIGDVVHLQGTLEFSSVSTPTGFINLTLPFTPNVTYASVGTVEFERSVSKNVQDFIIYIRSDLGSARIYIADVNATSSGGANAQEIDTSTVIRFTLTYKL